MRSLAEDLRQRSDEQLAALLVGRPDLARPHPGDLTALAARASTGASATRAVDRLDLPHLVVLQAAVLSSAADVEGLLGRSAEEELAHLVDLALLWRADDGLSAPRSVLEALERDLATVGPPAAELGLPDAAELPALSDLPPTARPVLEQLAWSGPTADLPTEGSRARQVVDALVEARVLALRDGQVTLPRELALRIRLGALHPDAPAGTSRSEEQIDRVAAGAASELVADVDEVLRQLDRVRPRVLRSGDLSLRDLRDLARRADLDEGRTRTLLEVAREADLLADDRAVEPTWRLTTEVEDWREAPGPQRWRTLVDAWLTSDRAPFLAEDQARANPFAEELSWAPVRALRADLLSSLRRSGSAPDTASDIASAVRALREVRPRRMPREAERVVGALVAELTSLGLIALGAPSTPGVADLMPEPVGEALLQADLTAVVPGTPTPQLAALLRSAADLESRGGASVYRFSETSIRGALDAGRTGEDLLEALGEISATGVPQPLDYLVRDVARRHGTMRAGSASSYLRSDDPGHLESLVRHRDLGHLQLRQIAPTVLVSPTSPAVLLESLREVGATPVLEGAGGVVAAAPGARRVTPPRRRPVLEVPLEDPLALIARLRQADARPRATEADGPSIPPMEAVSSAALLRDAAAEHLPVWVGLTDAVGATTRVLLHPRSVEGGRVEGEVDGRVRTLSLHRITGVAAPERPDDARG